MTRLKLPYSALAMIFAACGGNVALENSNGGQSRSTSTGGAANESTTAPAAGGSLGLQGGLVELTPDQWAMLNDPACAGWSADMNPRQGLVDDASTPMQAVICAFPIPSPYGLPLDPARINLVYAHGNPPSIRYIIEQSDSNCTDGDGWYVNTDIHLVLCAKTCATVQQDPSATLEVHGGCDAGPIIT